MGRIIGTNKSKMGLEEIITELQSIEKQISIFNSEIECYLFGSVLKSKFFNDVDVLIIYKNRNHIIPLKKMLVELSKKYPLHIIYLTHPEEKEFNFIKEQSAYKIF